MSREWVTILKFEERTGVSAQAVKSRIQRGEWPEGVLWRKRGGRVFINLEAFYEWVEQGESALLRGPASRSTSTTGAGAVGSS